MPRRQAARQFLRSVSSLTPCDLVSRGNYRIANAVSLFDVNSAVRANAVDLSRLCTARRYPGP